MFLQGAGVQSNSKVDVDVQNEGRGAGNVLKKVHFLSLKLTGNRTNQTSPYTIRVGTRVFLLWKKWSDSGGLWYSGVLVYIEDAHKKKSFRVKFWAVLRTFINQ